MSAGSRWEIMFWVVPSMYLAWISHRVDFSIAIVDTRSFQGQLPIFKLQTPLPYPVYVWNKNISDILEINLRQCLHRSWAGDWKLGENGWRQKTVSTCHYMPDLFAHLTRAYRVARRAGREKHRPVRRGGAGGAVCTPPKSDQVKKNFQKRAYFSAVIGKITKIFRARRRMSSEIPIQFIFQGRTGKKHIFLRILLPCFLA